MRSIKPRGRRLSVERAIGNTPLVRLRLGDMSGDTGVWAKLESVNPGGSIKDRPVARILRTAVESGVLGRERRVLDSSSGNAGISYAMLGAAWGIPVTLVVPGNASRERLERLRAHGAEVITTDPIEGYDAAIVHARRMAEEHPDRYWYADQYSNPDNWKAHYLGTGVEILEQLRQVGQGPPEAFVGGVGTGGTITGVGRCLREANPRLHVAAVQPERFPGIEGLKPLDQQDDIVPAILDRSLIDTLVPVTLEESLEACRELAASGLFVGPSSGCYVAATRHLANAQGFRRIVTVLNDTGERYVSTGLWSGSGAAIALSGARPPGLPGAAP